MRLLHTADWHLGQHLCDKDREEEHRLFLEFLLQIIHTEKVDLLIVAGDIFDNANPPNSALRQYYNFLKDLTRSRCRHTIIIGGNHDSVSTLNAPRTLLQSFNITVLGGAAENLHDEIITVQDKSGMPLAIVCAVPFLRDRDIRAAIAGELHAEREKRIKAGIRAHYDAVAALAQQARPAAAPVIATGHLYAAGSRIADSEKDIHIGNLGQVSASAFPECFDYVALGHLHRPQRVGGLEKIRYSGSPIPLSFSEIEDAKQIVLVEFKAEKLHQIKTIEVPTTRRLLRFKGDIAEVQIAIELFSEKNDQLTSWAEVQLQLAKFTPDADVQIRSFLGDKKLEILKVSAQYAANSFSLAEQEELADLDELQVGDVFARRCESRNVEAEEQQELQMLFEELLTALQEEKTR